METSPEPEELSCVSPNMMSSVSPPRVDESPVSRPSIIVSRGDFAQLVHFLIIDQPNSQIRCDQVLLSAPTTSSTRSRSAPSWRGRRRRGARDGKLRSSLRLRFEHIALNYFSPKNTLQDLALATVPGADFDPSERAFDMEELRPQPIIRKRAKQFVSAEKKDDKYWESRTKNTIAARR